MNITQVQARCSDKPYGTNPDEFDELYNCYHWDLSDMIPEAEFMRDDINGEDILWKVGDEYYLWINRERNYTHVDKTTLEAI